jgi:uncharacterized repeat protein (TIGR01451 family)
MRVSLTVFFVLLLLSQALAQVPGTKWINYYQTFGSNGSEVFYDIKATPDSGFILAGADSSSHFNQDDFLNNDVAQDFAVPWLVKVDKSGGVLWRFVSDMYPQPNLGAFSSVSVEPNGNIVAVGYGRIYSPSSTVMYISKLGGDGSQLWYKLFGGTSGVTKGYKVLKTNDGGYIVAGMTTANDGDVTGNHNPGNSDIWLLKLDGNGSKQWQKCFGGSGNDSAFAVIETPDNGFVVAGSSTSSDGDLSGNYGLSDGWIFKVTSTGNLVWQKNIGGANNDGFKGIVLNSDTSFTLTGYSLSTTITDNGNYGNKDLWVVKIKDGSGDILWSKNFGGSQDEEGFSIERTVGNGYLVAGYTESSNGDIIGNNGLADAWMLKLSSDANIVWQKCIGTNKNEFGTSGLYLSESDFGIAGFADPVSQANQYDLADAFASRLGNTNLIKGLLFNDTNGNGTKDAGEGVFNEALVTTAQSGFERSAVPQNGIVNIDVGLGVYSTSVHINSPYFNVTPASINSSFATYFNKDSITFAVQPIPNNRDLVINLIPLESARPGIYDNFKIFYKNIGTDVASSGEILFKHDSRLHFVSSNPVISSSSGDTLKWSYSNFKPFDSATITVYMQVLPPPNVNLGDTLTSMAIITPIPTDVTPFDDTAVVKQRVVGSYDPNDKIENNGGIIGSDYITDGKYLNYTIRFQNTGTDTAFNVIVRDTLDSKLDWSTFEMVTASNPYTISITNQNKIEWTFANINLPDSNINEPASHGYLAYRVKPKSSVAVGDVVNNLASIYFDYNLPVATNDATTLVQDNFTTLPLQLLNFTGQLTNTNVQLNWNVSNVTNFESFEVERSLDGKAYSRLNTVPFTAALSAYNMKDNVSALPSNTLFYRLKLVDADGHFSYSKVVVFRINTTTDKLAVYPNPARTELFVSFTADAPTNLNVKIVDASGRAMVNRQTQVQKGNNVFPLTVSQLKAGNYILQVSSKGQTKASKFRVMD